MKSYFLYRSAYIFLVSSLAACVDASASSYVPSSGNVLGGFFGMNQSNNYELSRELSESDAAKRYQITTEQARKWLEAGYSSSEAQSWFDAGVTKPEEADAWIAIDDGLGKGQLKIFRERYNIKFFTEKDISPLQIKPFVEILKKQNIYYDEYFGLIKRAWPYYENGYSVSDSILYAQNNVPIDKIAEFSDEQNKKLSVRKILLK